MKKIFFSIAALCIALAFSACGTPGVSPDADTSENEASDTTVSAEDSRLGEDSVANADTDPNENTEPNEDTDHIEDTTTQKHEHAAVTDKGYAATCTETGLTDGSHCSVCGEVLTEQTVIAKLAHTAVTDKGYAATCTATGLTDGSHCSVCGEVLTEQTVIAKLAHTAVTDTGYAATCTETGLTDGSHCSVCGEVLIAQAPIKATGHLPVTDKAVDATATATGLTEGSHCSVCGEVLKAQQVIPKVEPAKLSFAGGTITKVPTTIKTKHLELKIDANVYVPDDLVETLDIVTDIMEKVSGMKFEGNPNYAHELLPVEVKKDTTSEREFGSAYAGAFGAVVSSGDLIEISTLVHECTHTLQFMQSNWHYCQWAMEGITEYTVYKTKAYIQEHYPNLTEIVGTTAQSFVNMTITDYEELYSHSMEYWIDNILQGSWNANYTIGFRLMWYLDTTYGNYTDWIFKLEEAYPMHVHSNGSDKLPNEKILEAFYITYGESVFDDFYAWLKNNEALFAEPSNTDYTNVKQINLIPKFYYTAPQYRPELFNTSAKYCDLYIGLDAGNWYITEYKHKTIDKLVLDVNPGVTVRLFNSNGEPIKTVTSARDEYIDLTGVSFIQLVGEGTIYRFYITGFQGYE